jgi:hypothetical protein
MRVNVRSPCGHTWDTKVYDGRLRSSLDDGLAHRNDYPSVTLRGSVLVDQSSTRRGVADAGHELLGSHARHLSGEWGGVVTKVVHPKPSRRTGYRDNGLAEVNGQVVLADWGTSWAGQPPRVRLGGHKAIEVGLDVAHDWYGDGNPALACLGLGGTDGPFAAYPRSVLVDSHQPMEQVDVVAAQRQQLPRSKPRETGE